MATRSGLTAVLKQLPKGSATVLARQLAGADISKLGKVRVFPKGIPYPEEWVVSVLPSSAGNARKLIDTLIARPGAAGFEVFPYGIINPEIGRVDITVGPR
jgi:hypothetical protein